MRRKGFTLIELLVVIAILGILASMVLVALSSSRGKAQSAKIKAELSQIRNAAEDWYDSHNYVYTGMCDAGTSCGNLVTEIDTANGTGAVAPHVNADTYSVESDIPTGGGWCVDSTGYSGTNVDSNDDGDCGN